MKIISDKTSRPRLICHSPWAWTFFGSLCIYWLSIAVSGVAEEPQPKVQAPKRIEDVKFEAVHRLPTAEQITTAMRPFVDEFTIEGRQTDRKVRLPHETEFAVFDDKTQRYLAIGSHRLFVVAPDKEKSDKTLFPPYERVIRYEDVLTKCSVNGCCLDPTTRQLWLTTYTDGRFDLCRYDLDRDQWQVVASLGKLDTLSLCFHRGRKSLFAIREGHYRDPKAPELIELSAQGEILKRFPLSQPGLNERIRSRQNIPVHIHPTEKEIIVFAAQGILGTEFDRKHRSYILDLDSGAVRAVAH